MNTRWNEADVPRGDDYERRFAQLAASGQQMHGEADFVEALQPRSVLDAGCGTGRVARELASRGIRAVGADVDPAMLDTARRQAPTLTWYLVDLVDLDITDVEGNQQQFDVVLTAGNVLLFVAPGTEGEAVQRLSNHLNYDGALVSGFQLRPDGYDLATYDADCAAAGLALAERYATWDREPYEGGDYAVSVHRRT